MLSRLLILVICNLFYWHFIDFAEDKSAELICSNSNYTFTDFDFYGEESGINVLRPSNDFLETYYAENPLRSRVFHFELLDGPYKITTEHASKYLYIITEMHDENYPERIITYTDQCDDDTYTYNGKLMTYSNTMFVPSVLPPKLFKTFYNLYVRIHGGEPAVLQDFDKPLKSYIQIDPNTTETVTVSDGDTFSSVDFKYVKFDEEGVWICEALDNGVGYFGCDVVYQAQFRQDSSAGDPYQGVYNNILDDYPNCNTYTEYFKYSPNYSYIFKGDCIFHKAVGTTSNIVCSNGAEVVEPDEPNYFIINKYGPSFLTTTKLNTITFDCGTTKQHVYVSYFSDMEHSKSAEFTTEAIKGNNNSYKVILPFDDNQFSITVFATDYDINTKDYFIDKRRVKQPSIAWGDILDDIATESFFEYDVNTASSQFDKIAMSLCEEYYITPEDMMKITLDKLIESGDHYSTQVQNAINVFETDHSFYR